MSRINQTGRSAELSYDSCTYIAPDEQIKPLHDYLVVEPLAVEHSQILTVIEHTKPLRGLVKAVGPGHFPLCYDNEKGRRTRMWRSKVFQPTQIKPGDVVELGAVKIDGRMAGYSFQTILWGNKTHLLCREADISGVVINDEETA